MTEIPWIDWDHAAKTGVALVPPGPIATRAEIMAAVAELRRDAHRAPELIAAASLLDVRGESSDFVIDRAGLIRANVVTARAMLERTGVRVAEPGALGAARGRITGTAIGAVMALLATRILGQYDPFTDAPRLLLAVPNVMAVERELKVDPADFRMWVCLHEQTHRVQFGHAPWLVDYMTEQVREVLCAEVDHDPMLAGLSDRLNAWRRQESDQGEDGIDRATSLRLLTAVSSPLVVAAIDRVTALMSLLEGHADVMMDRAGPEVIPSLARIRLLFNQRRQRGGVAGFVAKLIGLDAKVAQYADGARFCTTVIEQAGVQGLNVAFTSAEHLPTLTELHHPHDWLARHGLSDQPQPDTEQEEQGED